MYNASGSDLIIEMFSDSFQKQDKIIFHCVLKYQYLSLTPSLLFLNLHICKVLFFNYVPPVFITARESAHARNFESILGYSRWSYSAQLRVLGVRSAPRTLAIRSGLLDVAWMALLASLIPSRPSIHNRFQSDQSPDRYEGALCHVQWRLRRSCSQQVFVW